jgi:hypothetical protein
VSERSRVITNQEKVQDVIQFQAVQKIKEDVGWNVFELHNQDGW